jgi:tRNA threonylcarbamoyladenosine biosynthesis protein TsaB
LSYILAFDTTLGCCSVALMKEGVILHHIAEIRVRGHVERLLPMIKDVCQKAALDPIKMDYLAVTIGPGTFAGVRIGLSAAKGMGLALGIPLISVTTLEVLAYQYFRENKDFSGNIAVAIDARRGEVYLQFFRIDGGTCTALSKPEALNYGYAAKKVRVGIDVIIGSGGAFLNPFLEDSGIIFTNHPKYPDARMIAHLALSKIDDAEFCDDVMPLYLRAPDATLPVTKDVTIQ